MLKFTMTAGLKSYCFINCVFIVGLIRILTVTCVEIKMEADTMSVDGVKQSSAYLFAGDSLHTDICLFTPTEISSVDVFFSIYSGEFRLQIAIGNTVLVEKEYTNDRRGTETFLPIIVEGRFTLKVTHIHPDKYTYVKIKYVNIDLNTTQTLESFRCKAFCFQDIKYTYDGPLSGTRARAEQMSGKTRCAEENNVNIPIFHENPRKFIVTAHMPKHTSFLNDMRPTWKNCGFAGAFWSFRNIHLHSSRTMDSDKAQLIITWSEGQILGSTRIATIEVDFVLGDVSLRSTASVGTRTILSGLSFSGSVSFKFHYYDRYNRWSPPQLKTVKHGETSVEFKSPDHSFREGDGNKVKIEVFIDEASVDDVIIGEISMRMRQLAPDKSTTLFKNQTTVIEGVDMDLWWRVNETMIVTVANRTFDDVDYVRISQREPWKSSSFSKVFVLYQDGTIRLLPLTPHGLDRIPFGSSVIIGQTDPLLTRPSAPINHIGIDPFDLKVTVRYKDGGFVPLEIKTSYFETQLIVSDSKFVGNMQTQPFFTFRSMYVTDGNCDVDHISADGGQSISILDQWWKLRGNYFAVFRKCISEQNTQSPDITLAVFP